MTIYTDGYGGDVDTGKDTGVNSGSPTLNYGAAIRLGLYTTRKVLIQFDLSAIPADATCNSATLYLYKGSGGGSTAVTSTIYPIASGNAGWPAGNKTPGTGVAGDCCWNYREQTAGSETAWAGSAGLSTAGTDYVNTSIGSWSFNSADANGTEYAISLDTAAVEGWFGASNSNYGMLILSSATGGEICSAQHTTTGWRPKLVVDYTEAASGVVIDLASATITATAQALDVVPGPVSIALDAATITATAQILAVNPITFVDGYGGDVNTAKDSQMSSSWPTFNGGGHANFQFATNQRSLIEFDLSSLPAGSTIISAKLHVYHSYTAEGGGVITVTIYPIAVGNAGWNAGNNDISLADAGECCWDALAADGSGGVTTPWAGAAGLAIAGTDYEATAIGSFAFDGGTDIGTEYIIDLDTARVAGWCGASNTNYGLILIGSANSGHIAQSNNATTGYRPKLVIVYAAPPADITINLDAATIAASPQALDIVPGAISIALDAAAIGVTAQALDVVPGAVSIALDSALIGVTAQALDVVPGAVSIALDAATISVTAQILDVVSGAITIQLSSAVITATAQALDVVPGPISITLDSAVISATAQALDLIPGAVSIALDAATISVTAQTITVDAPLPGTITIHLASAIITATAPALDVVSGAAIINLDSATITASPQALDVAPGAVSIALDSAMIAATAQTLDVIPGAVSIVLDAAQIMVGPQPITVDPGVLLPITISLAAAVITATAPALVAISGEEIYIVPARNNTYQPGAKFNTYTPGEA